MCIYNKFEFMTLRAIQQFIVHVQSFRNIDLWYQGAYLLKFQLYTQVGQKLPKERIYAYPFAHTQQYNNSEQDMIGDPQVIKQAFVHPQTSSFMTKSFLLRYYEEEVQLNDIIHFRVQTQISLKDQDFILQVNLMFYDQQIKKIDPEQITPDKGKNPKTKRYIIKNSKNGIHQFIPISFDAQYFSLANATIHSVCLDYRYRICKLQLFQFSRMSAAEKKKLLEKNKKIQPKQINFADSISLSLNNENFALLQEVEEIVVKRMKKYYQSLLKQYRILFNRTITQAHKQLFSSILVHPNQLSLFENEQITYGMNTTEQQKIYKRYRSKNINQVIQSMLNQTNLISGQMLKLWHHYIDLIKINPRFVIAHFEDIYNEGQQKIWQNLRKIQSFDTDDICMAPSGIDQIHLQLQKELFIQRNKLSFQGNILNEQLEKKKKKLSLMVQDVYKNEKKLKLQSKLVNQQQVKNKIELHLVVLVHGFQGNSLDMKLIKNNFSLLYPQVSYLCASSNEQMTDTDIIQMGHRLANEIKNHINQFFPPQSLQHISLIGHSLGGIIIRAALPKLLDLKSKFHTLITFSSPHLGYKVNTSSVIEAGIWFLQKFKNSNCLKQLTMADSSNPKETCLYKISQFQGPKYFKNIFLFSSKQDSYAPYESARIEIHPDFMNVKDPLKQIHCQMVRNILSQVQCQKIHRIRVNFSIEETNLDSIIGRTAHILFLENNQLIQTFLHTHPELLS